MYITYVCSQNLERNEKSANFSAGFEVLAAVAMETQIFWKCNAVPIGQNLIS